MSSTTRTTKELIKRLQDASPNEGSHDFQCLCFDAANALVELEQQLATSKSDARYQTRIKELEDALRTVGGINYDAARVRLSAVVDKALSTTTPDTALKKALLEARIDEHSVVGYAHSSQQKRLEELRAELAAFGE